MTYGISGRDYVIRAKARLAEGTQEGLFYAALELRAGIETRMHEYLQARSHIAQRKKHGYQVAKLAKGLEAVFAAGEKIVEIAAEDSDGQALWAYYFTPVRQSLRKHAERLGDMLHGNQPFRPDDSPWWKAQRVFLAEVLRELEFATQGTLVGPPLLKKGTSEMSFVVIGEQDEMSRRHRTQIGATVVLKVRYLDALPSPA